MNRIRLVLPALALLAAAPQDPQAEYKEKRAGIHRNLAAAMANIGEYLASSQMHKWARDVWDQAIKIDPDCAKAREKMGYVKSGDTWEEDPSKKRETQNKKSGKDADEIRKKWDEKMTNLGKDHAKKFAELGAWCAKNNMKEESQAAYRQALDLDPSNESARKALGYEKLPKGGWVSPYVKQLTKEMKEGIAKAPKGNPSAAAIEPEKGMGIGFTKQESDHFIIGSPHLKKNELEELIQHAEHAYAMWHKIFNHKDGFSGQKQQFVILKDRSQHEKYVDLFYQGDAARKELARKSAGTGGFPIQECFQGDQQLPSIADYVIHGTIQNLQEFFSTGQRTQSHNPIWLTEGMAYYFTKMMKESAVWSCVDLSGTSSGGQKASKDPADWAFLLRKFIKEGQDPDIRAVINCANFAELDPTEAVKSWSLCDFLIAENREKFIEFCQDLRTQKDNGEASFQKVFGWSLEELNNRWKNYAKQAYMGL